MTDPGQPPSQQPASVVCLGPCGRSVYEGGAVRDGQVVNLPFEDGQEMLTAFADAACPVGGTAGGCPNTTNAIQEREDENPRRLRQLVQAIRNRAPRSARVPIPALTANTPAEITVEWPVAMPDNSYSVTVTPVHGPALLTTGIRVAVKPGSLTTAGCVLLVAATQAVSAGSASLHIVATP